MKNGRSIDCTNQPTCLYLQVNIIVVDVYHCYDGVTGWLFVVTAMTVPGMSTAGREWPGVVRHGHCVLNFMDGRMG